MIEEIQQLNRDESEQILKLPNSWREKGQKEGHKEAQRKIACNMVKEGMPFELIAKLTSLEFDEIEEISKQ